MSGDARQPRVVGVGELTDEALTPGQLRALARDVRMDVAGIQQGLRGLTEKLELVLAIVDRVAELENKENALEYRVDAHDRRFEAIEAEVAKLKAASGSK